MLPCVSVEGSDGFHIFLLDDVAEVEVLGIHAFLSDRLLLVILEAHQAGLKLGLPICELGLGSMFHDFFDERIVDLCVDVEHDWL